MMEAGDKRGSDVLLAAGGVAVKQVVVKLGRLPLVALLSPFIWRLYFDSSIRQGLVANEEEAGRITSPNQRQHTICSDIIKNLIFA